MKLTLKKINTFITALFWHIYSGFPKSTQKEIDHRFSICLECEFYDSNHHQCLQCGCNINQKKMFLNKLAWGDQECPLGKWTKTIK